MGLRFIYGRSGCGKSNFCYNQIKNEIDKEEKIYMITPEQFSFTAEKTLLKVLEKKSVIKVEVITFKRMAQRIFSEVYGAANTVLSDSGKSMLLYDVLIKNKNKLKFLSNPNDVEIIQSTITDLKKHKVDEESLKNVIEKTESEYLKTKLNDLNLILEQYNKKIEDNFIDEDDILTILAKILNKSEMFKNSIIYIDEFAGFTKQEYEIIKILLKHAKTVNVTISTDSLESSISPDADIFYSNKLTIDKLFLCAKETNSSIEEPIFLDKMYRFKNNELIHLEQNLYKVPYKTYNEKVENIQLFLAKNPYSEIENVAKSILKIVREKNIRYRDISVLTKNVEDYSSTIKMIFEKYEIPVFIDEKKELSQNILIKYILAVLEIFADNWSFNSMFNYLKIGFVDVEKQDLYKLENYCNKYGIKGKKWLEEWKYIDDELDKLNELRESTIKPLLNLKEKIDSDKKVINITKNLYEFLEFNEIFKKLEERIEYFNLIGKLDIANQYATSINVLVQVLDELVLIFGNEELGFSKYREILKVGLASSSLGVIPPSCDQVTVGDVDRSRSHRVNTLFIIGLNDGIFPSVNKSEGFLNDKDREVLKQNDLEIAKGTLEKLYEDQFSIYKAFTTAEENLYLSYSSTNKEGKTLRPSLLITRIKKIFKNIKETSDTIEKTYEIISSSSTFEELLNKIRDFENGEEIEQTWIDVYNWYKNNDEWKEKLEKLEKNLKNNNTPEIIKKENIQKLYGDTLKTSVSRLEQYKKCPFSFYLKYGLKLEEQAQYKLQAIDTGSFMHDVIDEFFEWINYNNIDIKKVNIQKDDITLEVNGEEESLKKVINIIIEKKLKLQKNYIFTSSKKFISLTNKLKKVIFQSIQYILYQLKISDFKILGNEIEFENGAKYPPIQIQLDNGKKVEVTGKIDRVDIAKNDQGEFIRIIDYKSSARSVDLNEVVAGLQIQLLTYMDAITKIEDVLPAGILYFNLMDPIIKNNKNLEDEEIEEEIKKKFKMQGLLLADVKVIKMMDKNLNKGYSNTLPIYIDKDGNLSNSRSNVISKEKFEKLQEYIKKIIKDISKEILKGNIELKPFYKMKDKQTPCEYCSYKSICKFDAKKNCYNYIGNLKKEEVLENI